MNLFTNIVKFIMKSYERHFSYKCCITNDLNTMNPWMWVSELVFSLPEAHIFSLDEHRQNITKILFNVNQENASSCGY